MAKQTLTVDQADALSLKALAFLASDENRLGRFLTATGIQLDDLRAKADDRHTLSAVLDYLLADQSLLMVFAAEADISPTDVEQARAILPGVRQPGA